MLEVTDAVVSVWGAGRVGMHLAPRGDAHDMGNSNLPATFGYVASELGKRKIAFLCARESLKEPRLGPALKKAFGGVYIANEGFTPETAANAVAAGDVDAVCFGKLFLANPDLPRRIALKAPLNPWNTATFYSERRRGLHRLSCARPGRRVAAARAASGAPRQLFRDASNARRDITSSRTCGRRRRRGPARYSRDR